MQHGPPLEVSRPSEANELCRAPTSLLEGSWRVRCQCEVHAADDGGSALAQLQRRIRIVQADQGGGAGCSNGEGRGATVVRDRGSAPKLLFVCLVLHRTMVVAAVWLCPPVSIVMAGPRRLKA